LLSNTGNKYLINFEPKSIIKLWIDSMGSSYAFWMHYLYQPTISSIKISTRTISTIEKKRCCHFQQSYRIIQKATFLLDSNKRFPFFHQNIVFLFIWESIRLWNLQNLCRIKHSNSQKIRFWLIIGLSYPWLPTWCI
jgi:hypothetical protein